MSSWSGISRAVLLPLAGISVFSPITAMAQDGSAPAPSERSNRVDEALANAHEIYGPPAPEPDIPIECKKAQELSPDEIVVCARLEDAARYRVGSSLDDGDDSHLQWLGDAPDVSGPGIFTGKPTVSGVCGIGLNPCPPPPVYYFDVTALPEAPPGSDADKIAKGEMSAR